MWGKEDEVTVHWGVVWEEGQLIASEKKGLNYRLVLPLFEVLCKLLIWHLDHVPIVEAQSDTFGRTPCLEWHHIHTIASLLRQAWNESSPWS